MVFHSQRILCCEMFCLPLQCKWLTGQKVTGHSILSSQYCTFFNGHGEKGHLIGWLVFVWAGISFSITIQIQAHQQQHTSSSEVSLFRSLKAYGGLVLALIAVQSESDVLLDQNSLHTGGSMSHLFLHRCNDNMNSKKMESQAMVFHWWQQCISPM